MSSVAEVLEVREDQAREGQARVGTGDRPARLGDRGGVAPPGHAVRVGPACGIGMAISQALAPDLRRSPSLAFALLL